MFFLISFYIYLIIMIIDFNCQILQFIIAYIHNYANILYVNYLIKNKYILFTA